MKVFKERLNDILWDFFKFKNLLSATDILLGNALSTELIKTEIPAFKSTGGDKINKVKYLVCQMLRSTVEKKIKQYNYF